MNHRAMLVLFLCSSLLNAGGAFAQGSSPAPVPAAPPAVPGAASEEPAAPPATTPEEPQAAPADGAAPAAPGVPPEQPPAPAVQPPPEEAPPMPAPSVETGAVPAAPPVAAAPAPATPAAESSASDKAKRDRCAVLMAQGQSALAQAEGCGGDDQPIFAGSLLSLTQTGAPASRSFPDGNNRFAALSLYIAPRLTLTDRWALIADVTMAHEQTVPDDTASRQKAQFTDPRLLAVGSLGKLGGFSFTASPRITIPISAPSRAADAYLGTGLGLNIIRTFDVLDGLALVAGGTYNHTFAGNVTRESPDSDNKCSDVVDSVTCPVSGLAIVQDAFRVVGTASLNFSSKLSAQLQYLYGWNLAKKLSDLPTSVGPNSDRTPVLQGEEELNRDVTRWRKLGSLTLSLNYQPVDWLTTTLQGNTSVCYNAPEGQQSALGGCAGGAKTSDFSLRNPIANKYSTLALSFTVPLDIVYARIKNRGSEEKRSAQRRSASKL